MKNNLLQNDFLQSIEEYLIKYYDMNALDAHKAVGTSIINDLIKEDEKTVLHYSIPYWARDIYKEYCEFNTLLCLV